MFNKMKNFNLGLVTHIVSHLPKREVNLLDIAKEIPLNNKEAEKIIETTGFGVGLSWGSCNLDLSQIKYSTINI